jgi:hypothetical protein
VTINGKREGFTFSLEPAGGLRSFLRIIRPKFIPDRGVTSELTVPSFDLFVVQGTPSQLQRGDKVFGYASDVPYNPFNSVFGGTFTLTTKEGVA